MAKGHWKCTAKRNRGQAPDSIVAFLTPPIARISQSFLGWPISSRLLAQSAHRLQRRHDQRASDFDQTLYVRLVSRREGKRSGTTPIYRLLFPPSLRVLSVLYVPFHSKLRMMLRRESKVWGGALAPLPNERAKPDRVWVRMKTVTE